MKLINKRRSWIYKDYENIFVYDLNYWTPIDVYPSLGRITLINRLSSEHLIDFLRDFSTERDKQAILLKQDLINQGDSTK